MGLAAILPMGAADEPKVWDDDGVTISTSMASVKRQDFTIDMRAPVAQVWRALTTADGIKEYFPGEPNIQLKVGGNYETFPGVRNRVLTCLPGKMLMTTGSAPPEFPDARKGGTWGVFQFDPLEGGKATRLRLGVFGWRDGKQWNDAFAYFVKHNPVFLRMIRTRYDACSAAAEQSALRVPFDPKLLVDRVAAGLHAERSIGFVSAFIRVFDVEAQSDDVGLRQGARVDVAVECSKDPLPAVGFGDVNALEPPNPAVAPVAEFARDRRLPGHVTGAWECCDPVANSVGVGKGLGDAAPENVQVEHLRFTLEGEKAIELNYCGEIARAGVADQGGGNRDLVHGRSLRLMRARRLAS